MKNQLKGFITGVFVTLLIIGSIGTAAATVGSRTIEIAFRNASVTLDGETVHYANGDAVEPFIWEGTTYLPVRAIGEALGLEVDWDNATATVILKHPSEAEPSPKPAPADPSGMTTGQRNALEHAKRYLNISAFSRSGLIEQLEYEKYSNADATFAADNCGADWNEQAAKKAQRYLEISSFSRDSLIGQLEYDGFTHDQAVYGAEQNGY